MHTHVKRIAGLAAASIACAAPVALANTASAATSAAKPARSAGTGFVASTAIGGVQLTLSRDNRTLRKALVAYEMKCTDGESFYDYDLYSEVPIKADRSFKFRFDSRPEPSQVVPGTTFTYSYSLNGVLNKSRTKIVGTARSTLSGTNASGVAYTCDTGPITFTAYD